MSDSSISSDQSTNAKTFEPRQSEEKEIQDRFQEQSEWYPKTGAKSLIHALGVCLHIYIFF